jgi:cytoskeletal protein CcmA (bactofilin family)
MLASHARPAAPVGSSAREEAKTIKPPEHTDQKPLKPTEPFWKTAELPGTADLSSTPHAAERQPRSSESEADVRTLIIGPGVSVKGEITSCNRLIVEGKIEAKLADCPNVIIKEGGVFNGESTTEDADVQGCFDGKLVARKRLLVRATGRVSGNISYGELEIERGGKISGEISQDGESAPSRLESAQVA